MDQAISGLQGRSPWRRFWVKTLKRDQGAEPPEAEQLCYI